jgi:hypothetical protein
MVSRETYVVVGQHHAFPKDMLRFDEAVPASDVDKALIERFSGDFLPEDYDQVEPISITLVVKDGKRPSASTKRWETMGWKVPGDLEHVADAEESRRLARLKTDYHRALEKLSTDELAALDWFRSRGD